MTDSILKEIKCSMCNHFYNTNEKIPIALNNCTHNVCQACFISYNEEGKCPYDGKPFSFDKIMINKKLFELIDYLTLNKMINVNGEENEDEEDKKIKKDKEEKINLKIDLLDEFISVINTKFFFEDKEENINDLEKQINDNYAKIKNDLQIKFKNTKLKFINSKQKEKEINSNLQKNYYKYNLEIISNFKDEITDIKNKHETWKNKISSFMEEITNDVENIVYNFDKYSEEIDDNIKACEKLSTDINNFNEKFTKMKLKIRNVYIITTKKGEIQISFNEKNSTKNLIRNNSLEAIKNKNKQNNIAKKLIQNNEPNNNKNKEKTKKSSNNLNSLKESINSFCFGDDIDELINDENLISWDISDKNLLNLNDNNSQAISNSNSNSNTKTYFTDDDFINESFISNADVLGLTEQNFTKKKLTKDMIVFIKNKLKSDSINCSGYDIGDEGVKKLLEFMIKKNLELKISSNKRNNIKYKELKLSRCGITNEALNYIKTILNISKNTITHLNLSRNNLDDNGVNIICNIIEKNTQLKDLKLSKNLIDQNGKKIIEDYIKQNNLNIKLEI
jgi:hypothetical protein